MVLRERPTIRKGREGGAPRMFFGGRLEMSLAVVAWLWRAPASKGGRYSGRAEDGIVTKDGIWASKVGLAFVAARDTFRK